MNLAQVQRAFAKPPAVNKRIKTNLRTLQIAAPEYRGGQPRKYPWKELRVGETFSVYKATGNPASVAHNLTKMSNWYGKTFTIADYDSRRIVVKRVA